MRYICITGLMLMMMCRTFAQPVVLYIDSMYGCPGDTIEVAIQCSAFNNVGALTLRIGYDPLNLTYDTTLIKNSQLPGMLVNSINTIPPSVGFSWFSGNLTPVNIGTGVIAVMRFVVINSQSSFTFLPQCEVANVNGQILSTQFFNGNLLPYQIPIQQQPTGFVCKPGFNAQFEVVTNSPNAQFQWYVDTGDAWLQPLQDGSLYGGTHTSVVTIYHVDTTQQGWSFNCLISERGCSRWSDPGILSLDLTSETPNPPTWTTGNEPYPNPCAGNVRIPLNIRSITEFHVRMFTLNGKEVFQESGVVSPSSGNHLSFSFPETYTGVYFMVIDLNPTSGSSSSLSYKIIAK
jgi:hypothetical protein